MKKLLAMVIALALLPFSLPAKAAGETLSLDGEWDIAFFKDAASDEPEAVGKAEVPGALELQGYGYPGYYYEEQAYWGMPEDDGVKTVGVYRKDFTSDEEKSAYLVFESFKDSLRLTFNGETFDENFNAEMGAVFEVDIKKGVNTIEAAVTRDNSGINKADNFALSGITGGVYITDEYPYKAAAQRDVSVKDGELFIDGKKEILRAVRYTPSAPETGDCITDEQIEKDLALIKEYGFNCVLTSAAPLYFYQRAAEDSIYVIDEANVNLSSVRGEDKNAVSRVEMMVEKHREFPSVIMWSEGFGEGSSTELSEAVKALDSRPVLQDIPNALSQIEVFGSTGGLKDWVESLGEGNIGGVVKEFADKELYYTKNLYDFETTDAVNKETRSIHGEIRNYKGEPMFGDGSFTLDAGNLSRFTLETYISSPEGNRTLFESEDGSVKLEVRDWSLRARLGDAEISTGLGESGRAALVYADGEAQLFTGQSFAANGRAEGEISGKLKIGEGDGATAIKYVKIYSDALSLDELLSENSDKLVSCTAFDDIKIKNDYSYEFLAYGGDFGDDPNSYYKSLKGLFSSTREPHPEAEEIKALFSGKAPTDSDFYDTGFYDGAYAASEINGGKAYLKADGAAAVINPLGELESYEVGGVEKLSSPMKFTADREETLAEYERGLYPEERNFRPYAFEASDEKVTVSLSGNGGELIDIMYTMTADGTLHVSTRAHFPEKAPRPTFIGFETGGEYYNAKWKGTDKSCYPDRNTAAEYGDFEEKIDDLDDNYAIEQESGSRLANSLSLSGASGNIVFSSPTAFNWRAREAENGADIRIGGYIAGLSESEKYKLNNSYYAFSFEMSANEGAKALSSVYEIVIDGEKFTDFAPGVTKYVYRTNSVPEIDVRGNAETEMTESMCKIKASDGEYTVYFAPDDVYLSDISEKSVSGEIEKDSVSGGAITLGGDRYRGESDKVYEKGLYMKAGGSVVYDVSGYTNNVFSAVLGKNSAMNFSRGFNREMFDAQADVKIYLDGNLALEEDGISMWGGKREISLDISGAKELKIEVSGSGEEGRAQYEDAVFADAKIAPKGAIIFAETDGDTEYVTILNPDRDETDCVLSSEDNGKTILSGVKVGKGAYRTVTLKGLSENAKINAVVSGLGIVEIK